MFHLRADGGGILTPHPLLCQLGILLQHVHGIGQIVIGEPPHLLCLGGGGFHRFHNGAARLFHPGHGGGELRVRQGFVQGVEGVQLLLHLGQHGIHIVHTGMERHFRLHHPGRADLFGPGKGQHSRAQRRQQCPQPIDRKHSAQHHKCQRRRVVRQDTGLPGANDLAHGFLLFRELRPLYLS